MIQSDFSYISLSLKY